MATITQHLTLEEFLQLPERKPALEYEDGRVTQKVSPKPDHSSVQAQLTYLLLSFAVPRRLGRAFTEIRCTFGDRSYVPDVAFYVQARVPRDPRGRLAPDFFDPPDLVVEVISRGQTLAAMSRRCEWYVANGVQVALLARPSDESIHRFTPGRPPQRLTGPARVDLDAVLPALELTPAQLFQALNADLTP